MFTIKSNYSYCYFIAICLYATKLSFFSANLVWVRLGSGAAFGVEKGGGGGDNNFSG